jgi:tetratricopeptide (TPR) repeat protein
MRKKISLSVLVLLIQTTLILAQTTTIDSLKQVLQNEKRDSSRVLLLSQLSKLYLFNKPDTALVMSQQGLTLAKKISFSKGEAMSLNGIANAFTYTGNYPKALELHLAALKMAEHAKDSNIVRIASANIATDYAYQGNYQQSIPYTHRALSIARKRNDKAAITNSLSDLGDSYEKLGILDSARTYTNQAYDLALQQKDPYATGIALNNLGNIYSKMKQDVIAMANYKSAIPYLLQTDNKDGLCELYLGMAKLFSKAAKADSALYYAKLSLTNAKKAGFTERVMNASKFLTDYYISTHNIDSAFVYQNATISAKDNLFGQEKQREIQALTFNEKMRQQEISLTKAAEEKQRSENIQLAIIAICIVSFIILFLLLSRTVMVTEKWIRFLGMLALLLFFEFLNLFIHPYISKITHHSPFFMLLIMVLMASFLIPLHHKIEHWIKEKIVEKNKQMRLAAAKRTIAQLEDEESLNENQPEDL